MNPNFSVTGFSKKIIKPWGEELIYTPDSLDRTGKILSVKKGFRLSFQYHEQKEETLCLFSGSALLWLENHEGEVEKISMSLNHGYTVIVGQKHRIEATENSIILEVSSKETGTTVRVEDDYNRSDETDNIRSKPNRGWTPHS